MCRRRSRTTFFIIKELITGWTSLSIWFAFNLFYFKRKSQWTKRGKRALSKTVINEECLKLCYYCHQYFALKKNHHIFLLTFLSLLLEKYQRLQFKPIDLIKRKVVRMKELEIMLTLCKIKFLILRTIKGNLVLAFRN